MTYLNGKHLNIDENYGRYRRQGSKMFSWNLSTNSKKANRRNCNGL